MGFYFTIRPISVLPPNPSLNSMNLLNWLISYLFISMVMELVILVDLPNIIKKLTIEIISNTLIYIRSK